MTGQRSGKADKSCPKCEGRGATEELTQRPFGEQSYPDYANWQMRKTRCVCTDLPDPTVEAQDLEAWEAE